MTARTTREAALEPLTPEQAKALKPGDRVTIWPSTEHECRGTVHANGDFALVVDYDDQTSGTLHHNDCGCLVQS